MTKPRNNLEKVLLIIKGTLGNFRDRLKLVEADKDKQIAELRERIEVLERNLQ